MYTTYHEMYIRVGFSSESELFFFLLLPLLFMLISYSPIPQLCHSFTTERVFTFLYFIKFCTDIATPRRNLSHRKMLKQLPEHYLLFFIARLLQIATCDKMGARAQVHKR